MREILRELFKSKVEFAKWYWGTFVIANLVLIPVVIIISFVLDEPYLIHVGIPFAVIMSLLCYFEMKHQIKMLKTLELGDKQ